MIFIRVLIQGYVGDGDVSGIDSGPERWLLSANASPVSDSSGRWREAARGDPLRCDSQIVDEVGH
jgi:hypothetical protein